MRKRNEYGWRTPHQCALDQCRRSHHDSHWEAQSKKVGFIIAEYKIYIPIFVNAFLSVVPITKTDEIFN